MRSAAKSLVLSDWAPSAQRLQNAAAALGMEVYGYDPFISVKAAWMLSRDVKHITSVDTIYQECDYITVHVPLLDSTRQMINKDSLGQMKDGVVILNFARDLLVNDDDMAEALASGRVKRYITDFPNAKSNADAERHRNPTSGRIHRRIRG